MYVDELPAKKVGCLMPLPLIENQPYEFYRLAPQGVLLVMAACGLEEFTGKDVERIFKPLDGMLERMVDREIDMISQIGVPLPLIMGIEGYDKFIQYLAEKTKVPATSQLQNVIESLKHLKAKKVLLVNKWTDAMNDNLKAFLARDGMSVTAVYNKSLTPKEFNKLGTRDHARMAYELGHQAFTEHPEADALFIGGGAWMSQPVCEQLEREVGKPVISNIGAMVWNTLTKLGMWRPIPGHGRLLEV